MAEGPDIIFELGLPGEGPDLIFEIGPLTVEVETEILEPRDRLYGRLGPLHA